MLRFLRRNWQWTAVLAVAVLAVVLGYWGLGRYLKDDRSAWEKAYFLIYLFVFESGEGEGPAPWQLVAARWLAAGVAVWAVRKTALALFQERLQSARAAKWRGHVVICGLGRKGFRLAREFRAAGWRVAGIELSGDGPYVSSCRQLGVAVLVGNAADASLLERAGAPRARYVLTVTANDGANVATAMKLHRMLKENPGGLRTTCLVHLVDLQLCELFKQHSLFLDDSDQLEMRVFNTYQTAARILLSEHPIEGHGPEDSKKRPHLVVMGFGNMGQSVALQAAKVAHYASGAPLRLTVVDRDAHRLREMFLGCYPQYEKACAVEFVQAEVGSTACLARLGEWTLEPDFRVSMAVCLDDEAESLGAAVRIAAHFRDRPAPLFVRMTETAGLAALFEEKQGLSPWLASIQPFGMIRHACRLDMVIDERLDVLAQAIHASYVEEQRKKGCPAAGRSAADATMRPWKHLDPTFRDSSRQQADHIPVKLRAIGCRPVNSQSPGEALDAFTPEEVEVLAKMEHARWNAERFLAGWTLGPRDPERRTSPFLVPWEELPEEVREYDRRAVRNIPGLLKRTGEKVVRAAAETAPAVQAPAVQAPAVPAPAVPAADAVASAQAAPGLTAPIYHPDEPLQASHPD